MIVWAVGSARDCRNCRFVLGSVYSIVGLEVSLECIFDLENLCRTVGIICRIAVVYV